MSHSPLSSFITSSYRWPYGCLGIKRFTQHPPTPAANYQPRLASPSQQPFPALQCLPCDTRAFIISSLANPFLLVTLVSHCILHPFSIELSALASFAGQKICDHLPSMSNTTAPAATTSSSMFGYNASMPMAWIGGVIMSILFLVHLYQVFRYRGYYLYLFMFGIVLQVSGYWTRVVAIKQPDNVGAVAMTYLLITIAPSFIATTAYMTYGRIIYWVSPAEKRTVRYTWVPARWVTTTFVSLDCCALFISCVGIFVFISNENKSGLTDAQKRDIPYQILKVAFFWQIAVFFLFTVASFRFMFSSKSFKYDWPNGSAEWRKLAWVNTGSMFIITVSPPLSSIHVTPSDLVSFVHFIAACPSQSMPATTISEITSGLSTYLTFCRSLVSSNHPSSSTYSNLCLAVLIIFSLINPAEIMPQEYTTIRHGYKKEGSKLPSIKEVSEDEDDEPVAGYKKATLVPPPINTGAYNKSRAEGSPMTFNDPWAHRPSPTAERF